MLFYVLNILEVYFLLKKYLFLQYFSENKNYICLYFSFIIKVNLYLLNSI